MASSVSKVTVVLPAVLAVLCASNACAAETAEVAVARVPVADPIGAKGAGNGLAGIVLAADRRETNLQKTSTSIAVMGIEDIRQRRIRAR